MTTPGRLRDRIFVEDIVTTFDVDSDGEETDDKIETWVPVFPGAVSAQRMPLSGRELISADAVQAKIITRWRVRYRPEYRARMRIRHRSDLYNIEAVVPDQESGVHWLVLQCSSGVNPG
jgi:SPP1 family predicted phage head-tail adaptor